LRLAPAAQKVAAAVERGTLQVPAGRRQPDQGDTFCALAAALQAAAGAVRYDSAPGKPATSALHAAQAL
jgi:hypothetical protein